MKSHSTATYILPLFVCALASTASAATAIFDSPTDTIEVASGFDLGNTFTYEAQVLLSASYPGAGFIFNDWAADQEDKQFAIGPSLLRGYSYPLPIGVALDASTTVTLSVWHHFAYVYDGLAERLYLDGSLFGSRATSGDVADISTNFPHVGAIFRGGAISPSFIGSIDSLRVSSNARYTGSTFVAPTGDFSPDPNTLLLYNFNELVGTPVISDSSGNNRSGTLGVGFAGATSPELDNVPEPSSAILLVSAAAVFLRRRPLRTNERNG